MVFAQNHVVAEIGPTSEQRRWKQHMAVKNALDYQMLLKAVTLRNAHVICIYIKLHSFSNAKRFTLSLWII